MISDLRRRWAIESIEQFAFFRDIQWLDNIDSTNRYLDRQIKAGQIQLPSIAIADEQTAGAGRGGNRWFSPQGCLMFSMAAHHTSLHPSGDLSGLALLPLQVGLAVAQALAPLARSKPKVKWPNDVYIEDRKICGILIESSTVDASGYAIIGIGINCRVDLDQAPSDVRRGAVSLHEVLAGPNIEESSCESVLVAFLQSWLGLMEACQQQPDWIERNWGNWDWLADRQVQVQQSSKTLLGRADGIDSDGALRLIDSNANRLTILSGTVRVVD